MINLKIQVSEQIQRLKPYIPGKPIAELKRELGLTDIIKLASNENPLGPSPLAIAAARDALAEVNLYPDGSAFLLKQALSQKLNVNSNQLTLASGSESLIQLIIQLLMRPQAENVYSEYGFAMYPIISLGCHATPVAAKSRDYAHHLPAYLDCINANTTVVFIANPNNPTGTWLTQQDYIDFLEALPNHILVVSDEAYFEYVTAKEYPDSIALQQRFPNLITLRTFSKAYGLAGLRMGYAVAHPEITDLLNRIKLPFNINTPAEMAAIAALQDTAHLQKVLDLNHAEMKFVVKSLAELGLSFIPSVTNFVTIDLQQAAMPIYQALLQQGIITRPLMAYNMPNHLRVTLGTHAQNQRFLQALQHTIAQIGA